MVEIPSYLHKVPLDEVLDLARECGEAEVPSRSRDAAIWWLLADHSGDDPEIGQLVADHGVPGAIDRLWSKAWRLDPAYPTQIPRYTESLDAVLSLRSRVLPGQKGFHLCELRGCGGCDAEIEDADVYGRTLAGTMLRALLAALVTAVREVQDSDEPFRLDR